MKEFSESIKVSIFGKEYEVRGNQDEEYIKTLAEYVDTIMHTIAIKTGIISLERIAILAALNIADDMHKERRLFEENILKLEKELQEALNITS
jgi:cell division protein ZapA